MRRRIWGVALLLVGCCLLLLSGTFSCCQAFQSDVEAGRVRGVIEVLIVTAASILEVKARQCPSCLRWWASWWSGQVLVDVELGWGENVVSLLDPQHMLAIEAESTPCVLNHAVEEFNSSKGASLQVAFGPADSVELIGAVR